MRRLALAPALALAACGSPAASSDLRLFGMDFAQSSLGDLASIGDLTMSILDMSTPRDMAMAMADLATRPDLANSYPPGPYGHNIGDVITPLQWEGYNNPSAIGLATNAPYGLLAMNDLRLSGNKFALIYTADTF